MSSVVAVPSPSPVRCLLVRLVTRHLHPIPARCLGLVVAALVTVPVAAVAADDAPTAAKASVVAAAATAPAIPPLSIADAFLRPAVRSMDLSPDGGHVVAVANLENGRAILLVDARTLASRVIAKPETRYDTPLRARWAGPDRLVLESYLTSRVVDLAGNHLYHLKGRWLQALRPGPDGHARFLQSRQPGNYIDVVDVVTGKAEAVNFGMPGVPMDWVFDDDGVPLVATTIDTRRWEDATTVIHWYRPSLDAPWERLATFPWGRSEWWPAAIARDGKSLVVRTTGGRDTQGYFRYDLAGKRLGEMMAGHPTEDLGSMRDDAADAGSSARQAGGDDYLRVTSLGMKRRTHWFDARWAALQQAVDTALPDRHNTLRGRSDGRILVHAESDVDPGHWHLLDTATMKLVALAAARPHLEGKPMLSKQVVTYAAKDGLQIPAYLTLPRGARGPVPAVVLVHGGPISRDDWDWDPEVQLLASRGYAVLQPQFRGSRGFGLRFERAGYRQWGRAMQDDVTAGAEWLVSQGIADPARMCIYGGSYGGYAAMWAMASTPDLFRCGVSFAGVSDLRLMWDDDSDVNQLAWGRSEMLRTIGDPKSQSAAFDAVSPLRQVAAFKGPVMIAHGLLDDRVPIVHARRLVSALRAAGKPVEWMELPNDGHGLSSENSQLRYYTALLAFLDRHLGTGATR